MDNYKVVSRYYKYWEDYCKDFPALADLPEAEKEIQSAVNSVYAVVLRCFR